MNGVISRFVARRSLRPAVLWALLLGVYLASKTIGFTKAYPTTASRLPIVSSFAHNTGLRVLLGQPYHLETTAGFVEWNSLMVMLIVGAIWGLLLATKSLRGEEETGRWEMFLGAPTTARRATASVLAGLGICVVAFFAVLALASVAVGHYQGVGIATRSLIYFDLAVVSGLILFILIGAFCSQLMPTRGRAAGLAAMAFGVSFILRAMADVTSAKWLLNTSPLGWIERLKPLVGSQPIWFVPIILLATMLLIATIWLAGRRDLGESFIAEKDTAKARTRLLNRPFGLALRIGRPSLLGWLAGLGLLAIFYGALTKTAIQAIDSSAGANKAFARIIHQHNLSVAKLFLGVVFLIELLVLMACAASNAGAIRRDESRGYFDNLLVRPVGRWRLAGSRMLLSVLTLALGGLVICLGVWAGLTVSKLGVPFSDIFQAAVNIMAPATLAFGVGMFFFGYVPRLTSIAAYAVLVWSFLVNMLSSGLHLNHWLLDTSVLNQLALAPAVNPNWRVAGTMAAIGLVLMLLGGVGFSRRDLVSE